MDFLSVEQGRAVFGGNPHFVHEGIVDDSQQGFVVGEGAVLRSFWRLVALGLEGYGDAGVRDSVGKVDGAVDGIDYPAALAFDLSALAFFSEYGDVWMVGFEAALDSFLAEDVQFEFDVVLADGVGAFGGVQVAAH